MPVFLSVVFSQLLLLNSITCQTLETMMLLDNKGIYTNKTKLRSQTPKRFDKSLILSENTLQKTCIAIWPWSFDLPFLVAMVKHYWCLETSPRILIFYLPLIFPYWKICALFLVYLSQQEFWYSNQIVCIQDRNKLVQTKKCHLCLS